MAGFILVDYAKHFACFLFQIFAIEMSNKFGLDVSLICKFVSLKICAFDDSGSTWSKTACTLGLTNKTHTVCKCWPYGIVAVIGRDRPYYVRLF